MNVVNMHHMSEAEYKRRRAQLQGCTRQEAGASWEQELAALFHQSGLTQQKLADLEGKKQQWISRMLMFGRFLNFTPDGVNGEIVATLTEGKFRAAWSRTAKNVNEPVRFVEAWKLLQQPLPPKPKVVKKHGDGVARWINIPEAQWQEFKKKYQGKQVASRLRDMILYDLQAEKLNEDQQLAAAAFSPKSRLKIDKAVEIYKKRLDKQFQAEVGVKVREHLNAVEDARHRRAVAAEKQLMQMQALLAQHALYTKEEYNLILTCLHPDNSASIEKRAEAFDLFRKPEKRRRLLGELAG